MPLLKNPSGRFVMLDDEKEFYNWLAQPGFVAATKDEEREWRVEQSEKFAASRPESEGVFLMTVSSLGYGGGYGTSAKYIIQELRKQGVRVDTSFNNQKVGILYHQPTSIMSMQTAFRIIYTMFESDKIPDEWIEYLNFADKVLVPSRFCADVFAKAGIETEVIPLGYNQELFKYIERRPREPFTFLHYDSFEVRKGFLEVFNAFTKEFSPDEPVRLILKTMKNSLPFPILKSQYPNIEVQLEVCSEQEIYHLLGTADCFVFPSRGEGFGITPLEAMATGLPTIVPNAHGISEYFDPSCMIEVAVSHTEPAAIEKWKGTDIGKMPVVDVDDLRKQMRWVYENRSMAKEIGKKAANYVLQYSYEKTATKLNQIIQEIMQRPTNDKKLSNILPLEVFGGDEGVKLEA